MLRRRNKQFTRVVLRLYRQRSTLWARQGGGFKIMTIHQAPNTSTSFTINCTSSRVMLRDFAISSIEAPFE